MMNIDENLGLIRSTVNNIRHYRRLLGTELTETERRLIESQLADERAALETLRNETFPMAFRLPGRGPETPSARS
jgi:hypothetical protein